MVLRSTELELFYFWQAWKKRKGGRKILNILSSLNISQLYDFFPPLTILILYSNLSVSVNVFFFSSTQREISFKEKSNDFFFFPPPHKYRPYSSPPSKAKFLFLVSVTLQWQSCLALIAAAAGIPMEFKPFKFCQCLSVKKVF